MKMIALYRPDCEYTYIDATVPTLTVLALIVGTRGRSKLQNWGMALGGKPGLCQTRLQHFAYSQRPVWDQYRGTRCLTRLYPS